MPTFLIDHLDGCTPLKPCASCVAAVFLREKLGPSDTDTFYNMVRAALAGHSVTTMAASFDDPVSLLGPLSRRLLTKIEKEHMGTIGDVVRLTRDEWMCMDDIGRTSVEELETALRRVGHQLGETVPDYVRPE